ncbi:MAG: hypothetical protein DI596_07360, partial [Azospira oryzae]
MTADSTGAPPAGCKAFGALFAWPRSRENAPIAFARGDRPGTGRRKLMVIMVIGSNGQLGWELQRALE